MRSLLTRFSKSRHPYEPLITIEVSRERLLHNLAQFQAIAPEGKVAPVLKSNAYGHGLIEVAQVLEKSGNTIPFFVVDSYFEAVALRAKKIKTPILVIGYSRPEDIATSRLKNVSFTVTNLETLHSLSTFHFALSICSLHLKLDTGMHRQGILPDEIDEAITLLHSNSHLQLEGITSHLADADNADATFTKNQIKAWNGIAAKFRREFPALRYVHLSNTDGHRFARDIDANVSRLGLGLYGLPDGQSFMPKLDLKPALEMKTIVTSVKKLAKGESVGYSATFMATNDMTVATIPVGYYEALDRRLSNKGSVLVGPARIACPIVGRISMNITSIDVSKIPNIKVGYSVTVISNNRSDLNSLANMATLAGTIDYELVVHIPAHLKRIVV